MKRYYISLLRHWCWLCVVILLVTINFGSVTTSPGDKDMYFQACVSECLKTANQTRLQWYLRISLWNYDSNCKYMCMRYVVAERNKYNLPLLQYYGKWPFPRLLFIEEPASFLFSLFNLIGNVVGWLHYRRHLEGTEDFYRLTCTQFVVNVTGWLCACVFHTRDMYWTEKLDYFSAALIIATSIFTCVARIVGSLHDIRTYCFGALLTVIFTYHIGHMALVKFDYGYNMKFMLTIGAINVVAWLVWCALHWRERPHIWKCVVTIGGTGLLATLEMCDFPPLWMLFDGHSLWHLGTAPLSVLWYSFLLDDDRYRSNKYFKLL